MQAKETEGSCSIPGRTTPEQGAKGWGHGASNPYKASVHEDLKAKTRRTPGFFH